jgi:hypothetical protein
MLLLFFIFQSSLVNGQCRHTDTTTGECLDGKIFDYRDYETEEIPEEVKTPRTFQETQTLSEWILSEFFTLTFQFFGIVILFIILIILLESIIESE